jgi:hypothetical protein
MDMKRGRRGDGQIDEKGNEGSTQRRRKLRQIEEEG